MFDAPYNLLYRRSFATDRAAYKRQDERARIRQIYVPELIIRLHYLLYSSRKFIPESVLSVLLRAAVKLLTLFFFFPPSNPGTLNAPSSWQILLPTHDTDYTKHLVATVGELLLITSRSCDKLSWQDWKMEARIRLGSLHLLDLFPFPCFRCYKMKIAVDAISQP